MTSTRRAARLAELNAQAEDPNLWNDQQRAQRVMQERTALEDQLTSIGRIERELDDQLTHDRARRGREGPEGHRRGRRALRKLKAEVARRELEALLSGEADANDSYLEVHAGAGGTESQDWANMLLRMYTRWAEQHGYKVEYLEETEGEEAGIKSATIQVKGRNAYGWLKTENGVHRLVRISPFDSNARRHTSFASVNVYPVIDDRIKIDIKESDVRIDTMRAERRRRPARQQDRIGDPADAYPDQHRGVLPERPLAAPQPRAGLGHAARAALRAGAEEARGEGRRRAGRQDRYRLGPPDPLLRAAALSDGEGPAHRRVRPRTPAACSTATSTSSWKRRWRRRRSAAAPAK